MNFRNGTPTFPTEYRFKSGFNLGHFVDPLNLFLPKSKTGNAAFWDLGGVFTGTDAKAEAAAKAAQDALNKPVPAPPDKGEAAKNIQMMGIASVNRRMGRASTILSPQTPEDGLKNLLGG